MNPDCHFGDHDFLGNGRCKWCDTFNGGLLAFHGYEKAEREGRAHFGHFHRTVARKEACRRRPEPTSLEPQP